MAGFSVPTGAILAMFALIFYVFAVCTCIAMIAPISNNQTAPFMDYLQIKYGSSTIDNFQHDGNITDLKDIGTYDSWWNMSASNGLYAVSVDNILPTTTMINDKPAADIKFGKIGYYDNNNTEYGNLVVNNLEVGETDILFMHDNSWIVKNTYYYLTFWYGKAYVTTYDLSTLIGWRSNTFTLNNNQVPSSATIHYEYNFDSGMFTLWINGQTWGYCQLNDIKTCNNYAKSGNKQNIITDAIDVNGNGLNILSDGQSHAIKSPDLPSRSSFFGIDIPLGMGNDYNDSATIFLEVLVWNIKGIPDWFNLLAIKLPLAIIFILFVAIALSVLVSWIP